MIKNTFFNNRTKTEIKTTTTTIIKLELKYFPISEVNVCIAEPSP